MANTPGLVRYPALLDDLDSLVRAANNAATTLTAGVLIGDATLTVASTAAFAPTGIVSIESEVIAYTGKTGTTFTGCVRGADNTTAAAHASGLAVNGYYAALHHNTLAGALVALETAVGPGAMVNVRSYGAKGDYKSLADGVVATSGSHLTSASAGFTSADVGKRVGIVGAGTAGAMFASTIATVVSATAVTLAVAPATAIPSGAAFEYSTDDAAAFASAFTAVAAGGTVLLPSGTYGVVTSPTISNSNVSLIGMGDGSIIKPLALSSANGVAISGASHVTVADLQIDGNKTRTNQPSVGSQYVALNGIYIHGGDDIKIDNCYVHDFWQGGICGDFLASSISITRNRVQNGNDNAIFMRPYVGDDAPTGIIIQGNTVSGTTFSGIQCIRCKDITVVGNHSYSNGPSAGQGDGIGMEGCFDFTIVGNVCHNNGVQGIMARHTDEGGSTRQSINGLIADNVCYSNTGDGIMIGDVDQVTVASNKTFLNANGIRLTPSAYLLGTTKVFMVDNQVMANTNNGYDISLSTSANSNLVVMGGQCVANVANGLYAASPVQIIGGVYKGSSGEGLNIDTGANGTMMKDCVITDNADNGILVTGTAANCEIRHCTFANTTGSQGRAWYENTSAGPTKASHNTITGMTNEAFHFSNASSTAKYQDVAGNTNNRLDVNSGTATVAVAGTTVAVTHGLYTTPTRVELTPTTDPQSRWWVTAIGATTFNVTMQSAVATTAVTFHWRAWTWDS